MLCRQMNCHLAAGARGAVQPEDGAAQRITKLGEADLAVVPDGDNALQLGTCN